MSRFLVNTHKSLPMILKDERLKPLLNNMHKQYVGKDYSSTNITEQITPDQLDDLSKTSMPLCMSNLHNHLKQDSHLKHSGRMQYGLFLKGIGLKLEDALAFWKYHFAKKIGGDAFDKKYAYNIRHNYGKEGKRVDYTPYSCMKIIQGAAPSASEAHGL
jgi:DNA primase large subunit